MDPFLVVSALAAGAAAIANSVATEAVKDAYAGLRQLIVDRYKATAPSVEAVEAHPTSRGDRDLLAIQLHQAARDPQLRERASELLRALEAILNDPRVKVAFEIPQIQESIGNFQLRNSELTEKFRNLIRSAAEARGLKQRENHCANISMDKRGRNREKSVQLAKMYRAASPPLWREAFTSRPPIMSL
jgi:hypothetical protein